VNQEYIDRFWRKVNKTASCWLWTGAKNEKGYGVAWDGKRTHMAHRVSFMLTQGYMPALCVLHHCDNPACVNPAHLFLGTRADNNRDMCAKGRHAKKKPGSQRRGAEHHAAKMTPDTVREMRREYAAGGISYSMLAQKYGLALGSTYRIVNREVWKHVE